MIAVSVAGEGWDVAAARAAQRSWRSTDIAARLAIVRALRRRIAAEPFALAHAIGDRHGRTVAESIALEIIPLADAAGFLERRAARLLAPQRLGRAARPLWLWGTRAELLREPLGVVLVVAPSNYRLLLAGVQVLQALVAGNAVLAKPAPGFAAPLSLLRAWLVEAGLPPPLLQILPAAPSSVHAAIADGIDKVVLTGSAATGRAVLAALAPHLVPATLELSGDDPVFVLPGADPGMTAAAIAFGMTLNGGATCIAPRRVFVPLALATPLADALRDALAERRAVPVAAETMRRVHGVLETAVAGGARIIGMPPRPGAGTMTPLAIDGATEGSTALGADLFAPLVFLIAVPDIDTALRLAARSRFALGAAVFGPEAEAKALAPRIDAGVVTINDLIVPTADPRLPFGGRHASGYGVTRGAEGLLAFTTIKAVSLRRGRARPHYAALRPGDEDLLAGYLRLAHAAAPWRGLAGLLRAALRRHARRGQRSK